MGTTVWFGVLGAAVTAVIALLPQGLNQPEFLRWMALAAAAGIALRALRRKAFFGRRASLHKSFSFDTLLQGAILLYPQLPYPSIETQFLARNTGMRPAELRPWFRVRSTAAVSIPLLLAAIAVYLAGLAPLAAVFGAASLAWIVYRGATAPDTPVFDVRFAGAMLLGLAAAAAEGLLFTQAALAAFPQATPGSAFLTYAVILTAYELSPLPFALGVPELAWLALSLVPGLNVPGVLMPLAYRLLRGVPVLLLTWFYLPRYKMTVADLFNPDLARALAPEPPEPVQEGALEGPLLSVVIPAYNEEQRLPLYLPKVQAFCRELGADAEILVVDDGSKDGTAAYVEAVAAGDRTVRLLRQPRNQGKGAAVRRGVAEARGAFILFADADGATPIGEAAKLLQAGRGGHDVVIGSRKAADSETRRERSWLRGLLGSVFYRITNLLAVPGILDTQCGFKLFRRAAAQRIFPQLHESGWAFDVEILFLAQKFGMSIAEVPVNWTAVDGSKVKASDGLRFFSALFRIRHRAAGLTGSSHPRA
jgi:dolichyl-phosphate beta-glucosyltransferase